MGSRLRAAAIAVLALAGRAGAAPLVVYAAGDIADCRFSRPAHSGAAATAALIGPDAQLVLTLGDTTYPNGLEAEFRDCYHPSWGRFKAITRPVPGNHEYYSGKADAYYAYFGAAAGPRGRGYYSFDQGGWHFVALNSHLQRAEEEAQLLWLKDDLARHPARCTLAYWHAPLYSSGGHPPNPRMREAWRLLHAAGAELVLSGHDHDYERFPPMDADGREDAGGPRQFVAGTGGAFLTPFRLVRPRSEARSNSHLGVLRLELREDGYDWEFRTVPARGNPDVPEQEAGDRGSASCH
ncbi:metallophosphoesterase family protein [Massilia endophytica]|uniref:metallophosphoesterase family protein n=1 Tax=Massilia endophytica TaxID=2899220 RepID=UPI001E4CF393|nr:metallophosphoesterase [Massilia endophytica]UGQ45793.1 metallophosphoesterase [Massilia endophytica]